MEGQAGSDGSQGSVGTQHSSEVGGACSADSAEAEGLTCSGPNVPSA